eukprot:14812446-Alexandrium_andersonii.AAC.1
MQAPPSSDSVGCAYGRGTRAGCVQCVNAPLCRAAAAVIETVFRRWRADAGSDERGDFHTG